MKTIIMLCIFIFVTAELNYYVLEDMDINKLVNNDDDFSEFTQCLLEKIPCNKVYESYRVNTLEAVQQMCKRCRPHAKHMFWLYLQILKSKSPHDYVEFRHKYDPDNKFFDAHENELDKYSLDDNELLINNTS